MIQLTNDAGISKEDFMYELYYNKGIKAYPIIYLSICQSRSWIWDMVKVNVPFFEEVLTGL